VGVIFIKKQGLIFHRKRRWEFMLTLKKVIGKHVYGEAYQCDPAILSDEKALEKIVRNAAVEGNLTLLDVKAWKINPGVSIVGIILESHISIHTWPEYEFATIDVYTCGSTSDPIKAFKYIIKELKAKKYSMKVSSRDYEEM
jgi:S-adenosylmethionine decarboxylase